MPLAAGRGYKGGEGERGEGKTNEPSFEKGRRRRREWPSASVFERLATLGQGPGRGGDGTRRRRRGLVKTLTFVSHLVERGRKKATSRKMARKEEIAGSISSLSLMKHDQLMDRGLFRRLSGGRASSGSRRRTGAAGRSSTSTGWPRQGTASTSEYTLISSLNSMRAIPLLRCAVAETFVEPSRCSVAR